MTEEELDQRIAELEAQLACPRRTKTTQNDTGQTSSGTTLCRRSSEAGSKGPPRDRQGTRRKQRAVI